MVPTLKKHRTERTPLLWLVPLTIVALLVLLLIPRLRTPAPIAAPTYWPTQGWQTSTPEEQGFDSAKLAAGLQAMRDKNINIHSLLVVRNGKILLDATFYPYDGSTVHDVASVTKSVMTTLVAIAADQGKLSLDAPMLSFFSDRTIANRDARKERITVRQLASMSSGLECTNERDEETRRQMQAAPDYVQFVLDRKMVAEPGTRFIYCSPAIHLLSPILQRATGMTALEFARQNLFAPLGIQDALWESDPQGFSDGWGDLYLHPRDMAKIGYLWLNNGQWDGKQIVPREWVEASVRVQMAETGDDDKYGYGWWITNEDTGEYAAEGRGGQRIQVVPAVNAIIVTTGGGFEYDEMMSFLEPAAVDLQQPLPANPGGVAQLEAAVKTIAQPPAPQPAAPLPEIARQISGKTFVFEPNPVEMESAVLTFNESAEARLAIKHFGSEQVVSAPIGLDGVYRMSSGDHNLPQGYRGAWADAQTFVFEYDNIANNDHIIFRMRVEGSRVMMTGQETAHELGTQFAGRLREP
jgi:CubicO group peptidase (beta-lactamase class C family)